MEPLSFGVVSDDPVVVYDEHLVAIGGLVHLNVAVVEVFGPGRHELLRRPARRQPFGGRTGRKRDG